MLAYLAWLVVCKSESPPDLGALEAKMGPGVANLGPEREPF